MSRHFGERIRALRRARALRVRDVAAALAMPASLLSRLERGIVEPDEETIHRFTGYFGCAGDELLLRAGRLPEDLREVLQQYPVESAMLLRERFGSRSQPTDVVPPAAHFFPPELVSALCQWAIRSADDVVLDPSCGDGEFLAAAGARLLALGAAPRAALAQTHGYARDPEACARTVGRLRVLTGQASRLIRCDEFLRAEPLSRLPFARVAPPAAHALLGFIPGDDRFGRTISRADARAMVAESGIVLPESASMWAAVVAHAASFVRPDGRIALVVPPAMLHAQYAAAVRSYLGQLFPALTVVTFASPLPGVGEVVLVLGDSVGESGLHAVRIANLTELAAALPRTDRASPRVREVRSLRWSSSSLPSPGTALLRSLRRDGVLRRLGDLASVSVGVVTGANQFFILDTATALRLAPDFVRPVLATAGAAPGLIYSQADWEHAADHGSHLLCIPAGVALDAATKRYVKRGERSGIATRATCRKRPRWYALPASEIPAGFLTYMSPLVPRMIVNDAGVTYVNSLYGVHPRRGVSIAALAAAFMTSATLLGCELLGHHYGNGVLKLEPSEVQNLLVPFASDAEPARVTEWVQAADARWRAGQADEAVSLIDQHLLCQEMGVAARVVTELRERYLVERHRRRPPR